MRRTCWRFATDSKAISLGRTMPRPPMNSSMKERTSVYLFSSSPGKPDFRASTSVPKVTILAELRDRWLPRISTFAAPNTGALSMISRARRECRLGSLVFDSMKRAVLEDTGTTAYRLRLAGPDVLVARMSRVVQRLGVGR